MCCVPLHTVTDALETARAAASEAFPPAPRETEPVPSPAPVVPPAVSNTWYGQLVDATPLPPPGPSSRRAVAAAWTMFLAARRGRAVVTSEGTMRPAGLVVLALALALTRRRQVVLTEFLPGRKSGWQGRVVDRAYRLLLPRVCLGIQTMTPGEAAQYAQRYAIEPGRFRCVPFYFVDDRVTVEVVAPQDRSGLFASGKNSVDWDTLLDAAEGQDWPLTLVCTSAEATRIADRAAEVGVAVLSDIPRADHDARLGRALVSLVVLQDTGASSGHVRLATAALRETPVIASEIPGIEGYTDLTVSTVPPRNPAALRAAVNAALASPDEVAAAEARVVAHAATRPFSRYAGDVTDFIRAALAEA